MHHLIKSKLWTITPLPSCCTGKLSSLPATFQALGVLLSYAVGLALNWHQLAMLFSQFNVILDCAGLAPKVTIINNIPLILILTRVCTAPAILLICALFFLPESPSHLARLEWSKIKDDAKDDTEKERGMRQLARLNGLGSTMSTLRSV